MEERGLMPKIQGFPFARSNFILKCDCEGCLWNSRGQCEEPSHVTLDEQGKCRIKVLKPLSKEE